MTVDTDGSLIASNRHCLETWGLVEAEMRNLLPQTQTRTLIPILTLTLTLILSLIWGAL